MKCPVCKNLSQTDLDLHADGFYEDIIECNVCGATWSVNHGTIEVISDPQNNSFLQAATEPVESDDYNQVG